MTATGYLASELHRVSDTVRHDTIEEINVDSKAECDQLKLAQVATKNIKKKKLKQTNASAHLVQYMFRILRIHEGHPEGITMTMEERICER